MKQFGDKTIIYIALNFYIKHLENIKNLSELQVGTLLRAIELRNEALK